MIKCAYHLDYPRNQPHCPDCKGKIVSRLGGTSHFKPLCEAHTKWIGSGIGAFTVPFDPETDPYPRYLQR